MERKEHARRDGAVWPSLFYYIPMLLFQSSRDDTYLGTPLSRNNAVSVDNVGGIECVEILVHYCGPVHTTLSHHTRIPFYPDQG